MLADIGIVVGIVVGVIGLIPVVWFIRSKLRRPHKIEIDYKNVILAPIETADGSYPHGKLALGLYVLRIVNHSDSAVTLKSIRLKCLVHGKLIEADSYVTQVGTLQTGQCALIMSNGIDKIVLMGWENIGPKIVQNNVVVPGGVLSGSAAFVICDFDKNALNIENIKLVIDDYSGNQTIHDVEFREEWVEGIKKGFRIVNRQFTHNDNGTIQWQ